MESRMPNPAYILVYGRDRKLLETRCLVLESTGGTVHATTKILEAERILRDEHPDLLVLCYTLTAADRAEILESAQQFCPGIRTLVLTADGQPETGHGDHDIFTGTRAFKAKVVEVLGENRV